MAAEEEKSSEEEKRSKSNGMFTLPDNPIWQRTYIRCRTQKREHATSTRINRPCIDPSNDNTTQPHIDTHYTHMDTNRHTYTHIDTYTHRHTKPHIHTYIHRHTCTYIHIHTYTYIHTYIRTKTK